MVYLIPGAAGALLAWIAVGVCRYVGNRFTGGTGRMKRDAFLTVGVAIWGICAAYFTFSGAGDAAAPASSFAAPSLGFFIVWSAAGWACYRRDGGVPHWMKYPGLTREE
ncbi:hypothetical protein [uncultured Corynebacterium sp.]|uniref:hypothetical protein n=1 Tax=uncultured Corynebacterium sp. TaxID=159447 RepID=UPI0025E6DE33|nr:hypothetical protein [uncultured Corynebacterium sp.]